MKRITTALLVAAGAAATITASTAPAAAGWPGGYVGNDRGNTVTIACHGGGRHLLREGPSRRSSATTSTRSSKPRLAVRRGLETVVRSLRGEGEARSLVQRLGTSRR